VEEQGRSRGGGRDPRGKLKGMERGHGISGIRGTVDLAGGVATPSTIPERLGSRDTSSRRKPFGDARKSRGGQAGSPPGEIVRHALFQAEAGRGGTGAGAT